MNDIAKAYVAAIVDGEGTVTFQKHRCKPGRNNREWRFSPMISVPNSHAGLIGFLKDVTGVGITYTNKPPAKEHWSAINRWQVVSKQARDLLHEIRPFLIVKADIADVVLQFPLQSKGGRRPEDANVYVQQLEIVGRVRLMNVRGRKLDRDISRYPLDHPALVQ